MTWETVACPCCVRGCDTPPADSRNCGEWLGGRTAGCDAGPWRGWEGICPYLFFYWTVILPCLHLSGRYEMLRGGKKSCVNESQSNSSSGIQTERLNFSIQSLPLNMFCKTPLFSGHLLGQIYSFLVTFM